MSPFHRVFVLAVMGWAVLPAGAQDHKLLQQSLNDTNTHAAWIYNDLAAGFAEARKSNKPLLVVFR